MSFVLALPLVASGETSRRPVADTFLQIGSEANRSHGSCAELEVDGSPVALTYLKFDLTDLADRVGHATLRLRCLDSSVGGGRLYVVDDATWTEGDGCGRRGPGLNYVDVDCNADRVIDDHDRSCSPFVPDFMQPFARLGEVRSGRDVTVDVTSVFRSRLPDRHTFVIASSRSNGATYASREHKKAAWRPTLEVEELVNDECDAPTTVGTTPFVDVVDTRNAGTSDGDPQQSCVFPNSSTNTVWYEYTPARDGMVTVSTRGSSYDTVVSVHVGLCNPIDNALTEVACAAHTDLVFPAVAGTPYLIMVGDGSGTFNPGGGTLRFRLDIR